jgi:hypothetical protein
MIPCIFAAPQHCSVIRRLKKINAIAQLLRSARGSCKHASVINQSRYVVTVKGLAAQTREFPHAKNRLKSCRMD